MKIIHLVWGLDVGGIESMLIDVLNEQSASHSVILIVINNDVDQKLLSAIDNKVEVFLLNRPRKCKNPLYWLRFMFFVFIRNPDIFHVHQYTILSLIKYFRGPKFVTIHTTDIQISASINLANKIFCISQAVFDCLKPKVPEIKLKIIPNGIPVKKLATKTNYHNQVFKIVQLARLDHHTKGQDVLLHAFVELLALHPYKDFSLDFIGSGPSKEWLENLAISLNIQNNCRFLGAMPREYLFEHLCDYDLLVQPSRYEGFGLSVAEAMAAQIPVLVADIEGPMEIIGHGKYGYLFRGEDANDCAKVICKVITDSTQPWFSKELQVRRQHVIDLYDVSKTANRYLEEYKNLLDLVNT
jgi:glycosyltransferase involved in cell wall biosynthesis